MQHDPKILMLIASRLSGSETESENEELNAWLSFHKDNQFLFNEIKNTWQQGGGKTLALRERFSKKYIARGLIQETIGSLVGFIVGLWVSNTFTHYVKEKRSVKNLFGVLGRKEKVVNDIPEWAQFCMSVILGFIALELINYFFQSKSHLKIWNYINAKLS